MNLMNLFGASGMATPPPAAPTVSSQRQAFYDMLKEAARGGEAEGEGHGERVRQLEEIGFLPGEPVSVLSRGVWGGEPLAVRVGLSTFALRRDEARCIEVEPASA